MDERCNGWANRETWAFNLHWQNDQGMYNETLEYARAYHADYATMDDAYLGRVVVDYWRNLLDTYEDELGAPLPEGLRMFDREVGSWWRIDCAEVGAAVREALNVEGM